MLQLEFEGEEAFTETRAYCSREKGYSKTDIILIVVLRSMVTGMQTSTNVNVIQKYIQSIIKDFEIQKPGIWEKEEIGLLWQRERQTEELCLPYDVTEVQKPRSRRSKAHAVPGGSTPRLAYNIVKRQ